MPTMQDVRAKFPQYDDMSDEALANALYRRHYADMPRADFDAKIGLGAAPAAADDPAEPAPVPAPAAESDAPYGGVAMNATAGINEGIYGLPGYFVDGMAGVMNLGIRGANAVTGSEIPTIDDPMFGSRHLQRMAGGALGEIHPALDPANTAARTTGERIARTAGEGVGSSVTGAGLVGAVTRGGALTARQAQVAGDVLGRSTTAGVVAGEAAVSGAAGAGAGAAMEAAPDQWKPVAGLAGGLGAGMGAGSLAGAPRLARHAGRVVDDYTAPMRESGRERLAAERFRERASDPATLRDKLAQPDQELVPGSRPTAGQVTRDTGILEMEREAQNRQPGRFNDRRAEQNAARREALDGIQPGGSPAEVASAVRQRLDAIQADTDAILDQITEAAGARTERVRVGAASRLADAESAARADVDAVTLGAGQAEAAARARAGAATDALGAGRTPEDAGAAMRAQLEEARAAAKARERALWEAVDPDGTLAAPTSGLRAEAQTQVTSRTMSEKPPEGEEAAILGVLGQYGDVVPFREMQKMRSRLSSAMRAERAAGGETEAYGRMSRLRGALERDLEGAISEKVTREAEAVARGEMRAEDTLGAMMERQREAWLAERRATTQQATGTSGPHGSAGAPAYGPGGPRAISGAPGAGRQAQRGLPDASGDPGLSGDDLRPTFDEAARERLSAASRATRERAETFDNRHVGPLRARPSTTAEYNLRDAAVAGRVFRPGAGGVDALASFRRAVGDGEAMRTIEAYAVDRLRRAAGRPDGTLDPGRAATWLRSHSDALRSFPDLEERIVSAADASRSLDEAASASPAAVREAERGAATRVRDAEREGRAEVGEAETRERDRVKRAGVSAAARVKAEQVGIVADVLKVSAPEDVVRTVGSIFGRRDAVAQMSNLARQLSSSPDGREGLRKAASDFVAQRLVGNTEAGTSGQTQIKADQFQTFVRTNKAALRAAGFSTAEIGVMERIAADLQRANLSLTAGKVPGQSNTVQDAPSMLRRIMGNMVSPGGQATAGGIGGFALAGGSMSPGSIAVGAVGAALTKALAEMRAAGIEKVDDLVADAILDPAKARALLATPSRKTEKGTLEMIGRLYRRAAAASAAVSMDEDR